MSNPKISVIVPVYNAEKYLRRCIDSILAQTFTDFELLLIDDGSKDKSGEICDEYARKDNRVKVFHKENGGVSSARQCGLDNTTGSYVIHADPDDWCDKDMLELMYANAVSQKADMVICDYWMSLKNREIYIYQNPQKLEARNVQNKIFRQELFGSCWNKLINIEIIRKYGIHFPQNINLWEDAFFHCSLLMYNIKISYLNKAFYHYDFHTNTNSMVRNLSKNYINQQIAFVDYFEKEQNIDPDSLFVTKCAIIEKAFYCNVVPCYEIHLLFENFNKKYISSHLFKQVALCQCIKGHYTVAIFIRWLSNTKNKYVKCLKRVARIIIDKL